MKHRRYTRPYVGYTRDGRREVFRSAVTPTYATHGDKYTAATGPFRTARAARFMAEHGQGNPHCRTVSEAETLAAKEASNA